MQESLLLNKLVVYSIQVSLLRYFGASFDDCDVRCYHWFTVRLYIMFLSVNISQEQRSWLYINKWDVPLPKVDIHLIEERVKGHAFINYGVWRVNRKQDLQTFDWDSEGLDWDGAFNVSGNLSFWDAVNIQLLIWTWRIVLEVLWLAPLFAFLWIILLVSRGVQSQQESRDVCDQSGVGGRSLVAKLLW